MLPLAWAQGSLEGNTKRVSAYYIKTRYQVFGGGGGGVAGAKAWHTLSAHVNFFTSFSHQSGNHMVRMDDSCAQTSQIHTQFYESAMMCTSARKRMHSFFSICSTFLQNHREYSVCDRSSPDLTGIFCYTQERLNTKTAQLVAILAQDPHTGINAALLSLSPLNNRITVYYVLNMWV